MNVPSLTEPGIKYWMNQSLKECRKFKEKNINMFFNIGLTCLLVLGIATFLYYNYKGNITPAETERKNKEKHEYIISKLHKLSVFKKQKSTTMLTDLPTWNDHPELAVLNKKLYV